MIARSIAITSQARAHRLADRGRAVVAAEIAAEDTVSQRRGPPRFRSAQLPRPHPKEWRSIIAAERIVAIGLALPCPAMSGALPWIGSYRPKVPCAVSRSPQRSAGQKADRTHRRAGEVGQDVAEQVAGQQPRRSVRDGSPPASRHYRHTCDQVRRRGIPPPPRSRHRATTGWFSSTLALSTLVSGMPARRAPRGRRHGRCGATVYRCRNRTSKSQPSCSPVPLTRRPLAPEIDIAGQLAPRSACRALRRYRRGKGRKVLKPRKPPAPDAGWRTGQMMLAQAQYRLFGPQVAFERITIRIADRGRTESRRPVRAMSSVSSGSGWP